MKQTRELSEKYLRDLLDVITSDKQKFGREQMQLFASALSDQVNIVGKLIMLASSPSLTGNGIDFNIACDNLVETFNESVRECINKNSTNLMAISDLVKELIKKFSRGSNESA